MSMINPLLYHNRKTSFFNFHSADAAKGFAHDIVKRTHLTPPEGSLEALTEAEQQALSQRSSALQQSLEGTMRYLTETHGKSAATAAMGLIYKSIGNDTVTEETLGNALFDVTRFIDANYGFSEGDNFIHHLNSDLNTSMNALFDNGLNEEFIATTTIDGKVVSTTHSSIILSDSFAESMNNDGTSLEEIASRLLKTLEEGRLALQNETAASPYSTQESILPSGVMVDTHI